MATPQASSDLNAAVVSGLASNQLTAGAQLGVNLSGVTVGDSVQVDSLDPSTPSYKLVELRRSGSVVAVALVDETPQGYVLGSVRKALPGAKLPSVSTAQALLASDLHQSRFVWADSEESGSPYFPVLEGRDSSGNTVTVTPDGDRGTRLHRFNK